MFYDNIPLVEVKHLTTSLKYDAVVLCLYNSTLICSSQIAAESSFSMLPLKIQRRRKDILYLTKHSSHFIYGYMASDIL